MAGNGKRTRGTVAFAMLLACCVGEAQHAAGSNATPDASASTATFEVASVRRVPEGQRGYTNLGAQNTARFNPTNITLRILLSIATGVDSQRIESRLGWLDSTLYDVNAKAEGDQPLNADRLRPMLLNLLRERFHVEFHKEPREVPGYALVVAKGGSKLVAHQSGDMSAYIMRDKLQAMDISTKTLAAMLERLAGRPVTDKTGLQGNFDVKLSFAPDDATDSSLPSFFTAIQEQLGLGLEPHKVPVEVLVVDKADQNPEEN